MSSLAQTLFWISFALGLVVTVVAAVLLTMVLRTAHGIDGGAKAIWTTGKMVARNTVHIADLMYVNQVAVDILEGAGGILMAARRILNHAQGCPGCPACLLKHGEPPSKLMEL
ncbi:MAG: hypothetical protein NVS9B11_23270 [Candidatus Dormibacteraceae bacterium]